MEHITEGDEAAPPADLELGAVFAGASEMAARCRAFDWAATPLGPVDVWPPGLRTAAQLVVAAGLPNIVLWGPGLIQIYNDAYARLIRAKHPHALGRGNREVWPEVWHLNGPIYERVFSGETVTVEDAYYPLLRQGGDGGGWVQDDAYLTLAFSPLRDETGAVAGVLANMVETTREVERQRAEAERARLAVDLAAERERLRGVILQAPVPMALHEGPEHRYALVNAAYKRVSGGGRDVTGLTLREAFPEVAGQGIYEIFDRVYATGERWAGPETHLRYDRRGAGVEDAWFDLHYEPRRDTDGRVTGVLNFSVDVTDQVLARREVEQLLAQSEGAREALEAANAQLLDQQLELELATHQAQENAVELEMQAEALQATAAHLEEQTEAADRARAAAEAERARTESVLEAMADAYFALDAGFRIVAVNAAMERSTGRPRAALLGRSMWDAFPGTVGNAFERAYRGASTEGAESHFVHDYSDGRLELVTEVDIYPAPGGGVAVFWRDVTARGRAEAALAAGDARYRALLASVDIGFCVIELLFDDADRAVDYRYLETNATFERQSGLVGAVGRRIREFAPDLEPRWPETFGRVAVTGEPARLEDHVAALGRWFEVFAFRIDAPEQRRVAVLFTDVSAAKAAAHERERLLAASERARAEADAMRAAADAARAEAEAANRAKAEFLATMSHELRTPLNAIGGYAELMELGLRGPVSEQQRADLGRIQQSQRHLLGLVNEVLDLAKVDSGELRVERAAVRAGDTVDAALALVRPQAAAKALTLSEACSGAADRPYLGDEPRVRQVLVNLLANAVKFTAPGGRVAVTCALTDAPPAGAAVAPDAPYVALRVADTGVGIAPDQLARIFEPFTQAEGGLTRPRGGTGLGLAISRRLARLMGGDLTVESRPGTGSAFTLWLPTPERRALPRPHGVPAGSGLIAGLERQTPATTPAVELPGLAQVGDALVAEVGPVIRAWVGRLRNDPGIPDAAARSDAELEDHAATFVTDVALALRTMGQPAGEPAALLRDGTAILALIAERHGAQRARLGWPEAAITREFALLRELLDAAVRRLPGTDGAAAGPVAERAAAVVAQLLDQAARLSLSGYRLVIGGAAG